MNKKVIVAGISFSAMVLFTQAQVTTISTLQGDIDPNAATATCLTLSNPLRFKMKDTSLGGDVTSLQDFLIGIGVMQGESTGYFGAGTLKAVKMFQKKQGLSPTGYVGPLTLEKIKTVSCNSDSQVNNSNVIFSNQNNDIQANGVQKNSQMGINGNYSGQKNSLALYMDTLLSEADKAILKTAEDELKAKRDDMKNFYEGLKGTQFSSSTQTEMMTKMTEVKTKEMALEATRKAIFEKIKANLTDEQKKMIESQVKNEVKMNTYQNDKKIISLDPVKPRLDDMRRMMGSSTMQRPYEQRSYDMYRNNETH